MMQGGLPYNDVYQLEVTPEMKQAVAKALLASAGNRKFATEDTQRVMDQLNVSSTVGEAAARLEYLKVDLPAEKRDSGLEQAAAVAMDDFLTQQGHKDVGEKLRAARDFGRTDPDVLERGYADMMAQLRRQLQHARPAAGAAAQKS